jgi:ectoine hydroxylase
MEPLSEAERYRFECLGFLVLRDVLSRAELAAINAGADEHWEQYGEEYRERAPGTFQHASMLTGSTAFDPLIWHPRTAGKVNALLEGEATFVETSIIRKDPGTPAHTGWHRDIAPRGVDPTAGTLAVSVIYYLNDVRVDGGAFAVAPGSHRFRFPLPHLEHPGEMPYMELLDAPAGSAILFHGALWHTSTPNDSARQRRTVHNYYFRRWMKKSVHTTLPERIYAAARGDAFREKLLYRP